MSDDRRYRAVRPLAALALLILGLSAAAVAGMDVETRIPSLEGAPDLRIADGTLTLSLEEAIGLALERNLSLVVERYRLSESGFNLDAAIGIFDPNLAVDLSASDDTSPSASNLDGADVSTSQREVWNLSLNQLVDTGGTATVSFTNSRFETNSLFASLNPSYNSGLDFNFRQPLLRNQGKLATKRNILIAQNNSEISRETFELQVVQTLQDVENSYWTLVEAQEQLEVSRESLALAKQLHEQNRIRVDVGTLAPLELIQSEAGVATREEQIIRAEGLVGDSEDRLRQLLNLDLPGAWDLTIDTETAPDSEPFEIDRDAAIAKAIAARPELRQKRLDQKNRRVDVDYLKNQEKPRLDLTANYGVNGIGGEVPGGVNPFTGEVIVPVPGGYSDALDQITDANFDGWSLALNLSYPLRNRSARARSTLADVAWERGEAELRDLELGVATEVRRLVRAVVTTQKARDSAAVSRRLEEKNLEAEQKRYDNGMSTSYQVLEIQEDLSNARSREVTSITNYRRALVSFYRAIGDLLEQNGVQIVDGE